MTTTPFAKPSSASAQRSHGPSPAKLAAHAVTVAHGGLHPQHPQHQQRGLILQLLLSGRPAWRESPQTAPIPLAARDAALLAWLAIEGPTPRVRLAALLWPDSAPEAARNALRQRLFQLRKQLGLDLATGPTVLALADGIGHDLADADTVLGSDPHDHGAEFSAWLARQRGLRLERARQRLIEVADSAEPARDWAAALDATQRLLALDPLREDAHRRLMRAHYLNGDRAAALQAFDACERTLKDEVGTRPDAQTMALLAQVQAGTLETPSSGLRAVPASVLRPPRLIGRETEWEQLKQLGHASRTVLLSGEGGLGKSRLVGDLSAVQGTRAVVIGARPGDALLPYALLSRLLRALLARDGMELAPGVRAELARLLPELGEAPAVQTATERTRFVNAVEVTLAQAAHAGLRALLIDDLHAADAASVELLLALCSQSTPGASPCWLFAFRDAELPPATRTLLDTLVREHRAEWLVLRPLTLTQVGELLASLGIDGVGSSEQAQPLHRRSGGNPLYLLESIKARLNGGDTAMTAVGTGLGQMILRRIGMLPPAAIKLARCAAVAGQDFSAALASSVLQVAPLDLADTWNELAGAQVLRDDAFFHDLVYEAVLSSVPAPIARELHAQIARFLEGRSGDPARVAAHWLAGGEPVAAVPHLRQAARRALARFRHSEAAQGFATAARILEDADEPAAAFDAWFEGAEAIGEIGDATQAEPFADRLDALATTDAQIAKAGVLRAMVEIEAGRFQAALRVCERALGPARRAALPELESDLLYAAGVAHWDRREVARAVALVEQAIAIRRPLPPQTLRQDHVATLITMTQALGSMLSGAGRFAEARAQVAEAYRLAHEAGQPHNMLGAAAELCISSVEFGDLAAALAWAERGMRAAAAHEANAGDLRRLWLARTQVLLVAGRWGDALAQSEALLAHDEHDGGSRVRPVIVARAAQLYGLLGRRDLGLKLAQAELERDASTAMQRLWLELVMLEFGAPTDVPGLVDRTVAMEDCGLRARLLVRLAPFCEPALIMPLLSLTATPMREAGLNGMWMALQARIATRQVAAGRLAAAADVARAAWKMRETGTAPSVTFAEFAADVSTALAAAEPELARSIRLQGEAWLQAAAATLPAAWCDNCVARSSLRAALVAPLPPRALPSA